jgi:hypothetical protein
MGKVVTRNLTYAWIEYGDPRDGQAFTDGLYGIGWKNALSGFPTKKDASGLRCVDGAHPLLPIRWRGSSLLILPNERFDGHNLGHNPPVNDPIFVEFKKTHHDPKSFEAEIRKQNEFIADWVFCPGIKKVSDAESNLIVGIAGESITDYADIVGISGHGANGQVWGGGASPPDLPAALLVPDTPAADRLKYVVIATCYNVAWNMAQAWLPAMRRDSPIHGFLGYGDEGYFGDDIGEAIFKKFVNQLKAGGGSANTILQAWRKAHAGKQSKFWTALLHSTSAKSDTMAKWLAGELETPDKDGEILWFDEAYPDGKAAVETPKPYMVNFFMESTKISVDNNKDPKVGLFPGKSGALSIAKRTGTIDVDETFTVTFYYYRPPKHGMNLNALLTFAKVQPDGELKLLTGNNKRVSSHLVDGLEFAVKTPGLSKVTLPFTVNPDALKTYPVDGPGRGYFHVLLERQSSMIPDAYSRDGAWLREENTP